MDYNLPKADHWYGEIARDIGVGQTGSALIDEMQRLKNETGVPQRLRDVGISADDIPMLAADAITKTRILVNNPREMTLDASVKIYEAIL